VLPSGGLPLVVAVEITPQDLLLAQVTAPKVAVAMEHKALSSWNLNEVKQTPVVEVVEVAPRPAA
jgi:hypothetical protein